MERILWLIADVCVIFSGVITTAALLITNNVMFLILLVVWAACGKVYEKHRPAFLDP